MYLEMRGCTKNSFSWLLRAMAEEGGGDCSPEFVLQVVTAAADSAWRCTNVEGRRDAVGSVGRGGVRLGEGDDPRVPSVSEGEGVG